MCRLASFFFHRPDAGDIVVYDLNSHSGTAKQLELNENVWCEGHYLPSGEVECRVPPESHVSQADCDERLKNRFPRFVDFLAWAFKNGARAEPLDLRGLTSAEGRVLPQSVGGWLNLSEVARS